nr:HTH domain-containing protein [Candidatus Fimenecus sp.]
MSVKNDIRSELEAHRGEDISGQYLAEKLGVSRNAVWKAINSLKNDGYKITSSTNKGYCLSESCDILSQSTIERLCGENTDIKIFESLDST